MNNRLVFCLITAVVLGSCGKEGEKSDVLVSGAWQPTMQDNYTQNNPEGRLVYAPISPCETDDVYFFGGIGQLIIQDGALRCNAQEEPVELPYLLNSDKTKITINGINYDYLGIHQNQLKYALPLPPVTGYSYQVFIFNEVSN